MLQKVIKSYIHFITIYHEQYNFFMTKYNFL